MRASARVEVARSRGRDVLVDLRSEPPLTVRAVGGRVLVVGSAAAPVGGDELDLELVVGPGARLVAGTVAASLAWPGPTGAASHQRLRIDVGDDGDIAWTPEPLVAVAGCDHHATTSVSLTGGATAWLVEEVALGRAGEPSGDLALTWSITRDGRPLLRHTERLGPSRPGWGGAAVAGPFRHLVAAVAVGHPVGPGAGPSHVTPTAAAARLAIADDVTMLLVAAVDRPAARTALARWTPPPSRVSSHPGVSCPPAPHETPDCGQASDGS